MLRTFKLTIEYDGSRFHGWQIQPSDRSIQSEIQKVLRIMTGAEITVAGSGRTDARVHAKAQVAHFRADTKISPEKFHNALNKMLPEDIVIRDCVYAPGDFHARFNAKKKTYHYRILNSRQPVAIKRQYLWHIIKKLDLDAMQKAADHLIGEKDFKAFEGTGSPRSTTIRTIFRACFTRDNEFITFEITGSGFLKFMVRNITGSLVDVGLGKTSPEKFRSILLSKDRNRAGATAPPHGLCLMNVEY